MKKQDIKKILKPIVQECLTEIFAEIQLETIVENVLCRAQPSLQNTKTNKETSAFRGLYSEIKDESASHYDNIQQPTKKSLVEQKIESLNDNIFKDIYKDTLRSDNPILNPENKEISAPEISESTLQKMGLLKDYSKFVSDDSELQEQPINDDWNSRLEKQKTILASTIKRNERS